MTNLYTGLYIYKFSISSLNMVVNKTLLIQKPDVYVIIVHRMHGVYQHSSPFVLLLPSSLDAIVTGSYR